MWVYIHKIINTYTPVDGDFLKQCEEIAISTIHQFNTTDEDINVVLRFDPNDVILWMRTSWYTINGYMFNVVLDWDKDKWFNELLIWEYKSCIIHELHHVLRRNYPWYWKSFREVLISEWLACVAEVEQNPKHDILYIKSSPEELYELGLFAINQSNDYDHRERYFGSWKLPNWSWYKLWYHLLSQYTNVTQKTSRDLLKMSWIEIMNDPLFQKLLTS